MLAKVKNLVTGVTRRAQKSKDEPVRGELSAVLAGVAKQVGETESAAQAGCPYVAGLVGQGPAGQFSNAQSPRGL